MSKGKISGHYVSSILAKREVQASGYDEAIMLDTQGYVSETSAANIFVVRDGEVATPPMGVSILGGITRSTVMRLMENLGLTVHERLISRDELYIADEVTPVRELDDRQVGKGSRGPITERVQNAYCDAVRGVRVPDEGWLTIV
jgi:branched-chain amino acid aminotransferase